MLTRALFIDLSLYGCLCFIFSWDFPLFFDYEKHHIKICSTGDKTFIFVLLCTLSFVSFFNGLSLPYAERCDLCVPPLLVLPILHTTNIHYIFEFTFAKTVHSVHVHSMCLLTFLLSNFLDKVQ